MVEPPKTVGECWVRRRGTLGRTAGCRRRRGCNCRCRCRWRRGLTLLLDHLAHLITQAVRQNKIGERLACQLLRFDCPQRVRYADEKCASRLRLALNFHSEPMRLRGREQFHRKSLGLCSSEQNCVVAFGVELNCLCFCPDWILIAFLLVESEDNFRSAAQGVATDVAQCAVKLDVAWHSDAVALRRDGAGRRRFARGSLLLRLH